MSTREESFPDDVRHLVARRLRELGIVHSPITADELTARFTRREVSVVAIHYAVEVEGQPAALTVTPLTEREVDDFAPMMRVTKEVERLQRTGRLVSYHQVIVAPRGSVLLDLVPPPQPPVRQSFEAAGTAFIQELLDHDAVRPLMR